jgi:hypothetical protein
MTEYKHVNHGTQVEIGSTLVGVVQITRHEGRPVTQLLVREPGGRQDYVTVYEGDTVDLLGAGSAHIDAIHPEGEHPERYFAMTVTEA